MKTTTALAFVSLVFSCDSATQAVTIDTVPVGNADNAADTEVMDDGTTGYGSVSYEYRIGKTEVTNAQYVEFLNAVAASDPYGLYHVVMSNDTRGGITRDGLSGSYTYEVKGDSIGNGPGGADGDNYTYGDKPVVWVSWYDSIRFANWLHNGQGRGDTETGAYTLGPLDSSGIPIDSDSITRNPGAIWFLPSEDQWYKAAYHQNDGVTGNYWDYPTATDTVPDNNLPSADTGNSANFWDPSLTTGDPSYPMTDAGAYTLSDSPYGTFDQGGNAIEWNETLISPFTRDIRGGAWTPLSLSDSLSSSSRRNFFPTSASSVIGFRVASIPEPSTLLLAALSALGLLMRRRSLR
jgi:sulfatase modifying factor 1